ncbi:DinB family protein [Paenibacillus agricola]|uniref:DUF664 domain-containing protein n=1 Tax=Paenibacillus agricola TaxID=2716264 RepID=A0ABX0JFK8_9BACL|nr:DUF664 domain-containing protein [Paenibacillus agricola]NHN32475.1 DUF664 domain-containing protein [Paenibacillus agricola]
MVDVVSYAIQAMDSDLAKINASFQRLSAETVWKRLRESTNSVGNLCLHLAGAEYQRISSAIGGKPLIRERTLEFTADGGLTPAELSEKLQRVREESIPILRQLTEQDMEREIPMYFQPDDWKRMYRDNPNFDKIPAYSSQSISLIILGLVAHYSYHTGQIVMLTKAVQDGDEQLLQWKH